MVPSYGRTTMAGRGKHGVAQRRIAAAAKRERNRLGWTQEKAAERASLNIRHYQKVEDGSVNLTIKSLEQLAMAFGVDLLDLLRE